MLPTGHTQRLAENKAVLRKRSQIWGETGKEQSLAVSWGRSVLRAPLCVGAFLRPQALLPSSFPKLSSSRTLLPALGEDGGVPCGGGR